jgi:hypothetical protein
MRLILLALVAITAFAGPAAADVTIDGPPVIVCVGATCTPCPDPVVVPTPPEIGISYQGGDCN